MKRLAILMVVLLVGVAQGQWTDDGETVSFQIFNLGEYGASLALENDDSVYIYVTEPGRDSVWAEVIAGNDADLVRHKFGSGGFSVPIIYKQSVGTLDGSSTAEGIFRVSIVVYNIDSTLTTPHIFDMPVYRDATFGTWADEQMTVYDEVADHLDADISSRSTLTAAQVDTECDEALTNYDPPTDTEMDNAFAGLNDLSAAEVNAEADQALVDYDPPTDTEMDNAFAALNDISAADVDAECDEALATYDPPTKAELDAGFAALNDLDGSEITDELVSFFDTTDQLADTSDVRYAILNADSTYHANDSLAGTMGHAIAFGQSGDASTVTDSITDLMAAKIGHYTWTADSATYLNDDTTAVMATALHSSIDAGSFDPESDFVMVDSIPDGYLSASKFSDSLLTDKDTLITWILDSLGNHDYGYGDEFTGDDSTFAAKLAMAQEGGAASITDADMKAIGDTIWQRANVDIDSDTSYVGWKLAALTFANSTAGSLIVDKTGVRWSFGTEGDTTGAGAFLAEYFFTSDEDMARIYDTTQRAYRGAVDDTLTLLAGDVDDIKVVTDKLTFDAQDSLVVSGDGITAGSGQSFDDSITTIYGVLDKLTFDAQDSLIVSGDGITAGSGQSFGDTITTMYTALNAVRDSMEEASQVGGTGSGSDPLEVYVFNDADTSAINNALVTVDTKWDGAGTEYATITDGSGKATFGMTDGDSLLLIATLPAFSTAFDSLIKASGTDVDSLFLTGHSVGNPEAANICSVYGFLYDITGDSIAGAMVKFTLSSSVDTLIDGTVAIIPKVATTHTEASGYFSIGVTPNAIIDTKSSYSIEVKKGTLIDRTFKVFVPDSSTVHFNTLLRSYRR